MLRSCEIGSITIGPGRPPAIIAGPCVLESKDINDHIGTVMRDLCADTELPYIFKASFDKANRSSIHSSRGPGLEAGREELIRLREHLGVPVTTDVHEPHHADSLSGAADLLQVPAFLCRQTDLLVACADTGLAVNVKKGQFMAPAEMENVVAKLDEAGARNIMLTERGTFFGYHRLVNDFAGVGELIDLGVPVCFDVTHSTQLPGGGGTHTGGRPESAPLLARAAAAVGVHAFFIECHPDPARGLSDAATMLPLDAMPALLRQIKAVHAAAQTS